MKVASKVLLGTAMGAGMLALSAVSASATIVCSGNVCWHATERYDTRRNHASSSMKIHGSRALMPKSRSANTRDVATGGMTSGSSGSQGKRPPQLAASFFNRGGPAECLHYWQTRLCQRV